MLLLHAGQTVSKEELLNEVWRDTHVQEDTLTQNISTIRKALGDTTDSPRYVLTVPREGYRFIAPVNPVVPNHRTGRAHPVDLPRSQPRGRRALWLHYMAGITLGLAFGAIILPYWNSRVDNSAAVGSGLAAKFEVFEPEGHRFSTAGGVLSISPDGRYLAFLATEPDGTDNLWVRPMNSLQSRKLPGTRDASQPFWSADSKSVAFFSSGSPRKVDIAGGAPQTVGSRAIGLPTKPVQPRRWPPADLPDKPTT